MLLCQALLAVLIPLTVEPTNSVKTPVVIRPEYVMYLEWFNNSLWFHTDVFRWSKEVKSKFIEDFKTLQSLLPQPLVSLILEDNFKLCKFARLIGMKRDNTIMLNNGLKAHIYAVERTGSI